MNIFKVLLTGSFLLGLLSVQQTKAKDRPDIPKRLNIILFTADDLGSDGVGIGAFGSKMKDLTPEIDKLAMASVRFANAHVNSAICMPSRGIIATGLYGFNSGHHGFMYAKEEVHTMMEQFQESGYKTGVIGKVSHSSAKLSTRWDYFTQYEDLGYGRSPSKYYSHTYEFISKCKNDKQPFYLMVNSHDPHRPYQKPDGELKRGAEWPSKMYAPREAYVPGFLPDMPQVRKEMSYYYNSTRRLDDTFGKVMQAVRDAKQEKNTVVIFLSDNGIAMPFSKANCYLKSTKTAFFVHLPELFKPKLVDGEMISTIDLYPTIMEILGLEKPEGIDGKSFLPLLQGEKQKGRKMVFTQIDYINRATPYPMRCIQDIRYGYIFNPWSNGEQTYHNANEGGVVKAMTAQSENQEILDRINVFRYRNPEEFYDLEKDPDCILNLINDRKYQQLIKKYRSKLERKMQETGDPLLRALPFVHDSDKLSAICEEIYQKELPFRKGDNKKYERLINGKPVQ